jgi:apolipoprotein N-acyltransferase
LQALAARQQAALVVGTFSEPVVAEGERTPLMRAMRRETALYNAAALVDADGPLTYGGHRVKHHLIPFFERLPYADRVPGPTLWLSRRMPLPVWNAGPPPAPLPLATARGTRWLGTLICYEQLIPQASARLARRGAEVLVVLTNEHWTTRQAGLYMVSVTARLRAIETRRPLVRASHTGLTYAVDRYGRLRASVPAHTRTTMTASVRGAVGVSPFARYPNAFALLCAGGVLVLLVAGGGRQEAPVPVRTPQAAV